MDEKRHSISTYLLPLTRIYGTWLFGVTVRIQKARRSTSWLGVRSSNPPPNPNLRLLSLKARPVDLLATLLSSSSFRFAATIFFPHFFQRFTMSIASASSVKALDLQCGFAGTRFPSPLKVRQSDTYVLGFGFVVVRVMMREFRLSEDMQVECEWFEFQCWTRMVRFGFVSG